MEFPRQEYRSRLPFSSPGDLPNPGIELKSSSLAGRFFTAESPGKPYIFHTSKEVAQLRKLIQSLDVKRIRSLLLNQFSSVAQLCLTLRPHELQHTRPPCPSPTPGVYSNSCPSSQWCHPAISSSVVPFSSCLQPLPASGSFPMSQLFAWGGQSIRVSASASVLPMNTQDWSPLWWTGWISLQWIDNLK